MKILLKIGDVHFPKFLQFLNKNIKIQQLVLFLMLNT